MKKIMIAFAWTVCVLTACDKNKPSQTEMQALPVDVAKPLVENVTLTKDYPGYLEAESTVDLLRLSPVRIRISCNPVSAIAAISFSISSAFNCARLILL